MPPGLRVRLSHDGTVLYEANLPGARRAVSVTVDPQPLYGRGIACRTPRGPSPTHSRTVPATGLIAMRLPHWTA
jgi:hypothetical protein